MQIPTKLITQTVERGKIQITNILNKIGVMDMNSINIWYWTMNIDIFYRIKEYYEKLFALTADSLDKMYEFLGDNKLLSLHERK